MGRSLAGLLRRIVGRAVIVAACGLTLLPVQLSAQPAEDTLIRWDNDLEHAMNQAFIHNQHLLVYVYSDYCGYCSLLNTKGLRDSSVIDLLNNRLVSVKLDAMGQAPIWFKGSRYRYNQAARVHELAYLLLDGQLEYPAWVVMNRKGEIVAEVHGYFEPDDLYKLLLYFAESAYMTQTWESFSMSLAR